MPDAPTEAEELFCPACGYDLRGTSSDRCSECGEVINRDNLAVSRLPWTHRRHLGCVRAWWRTVLLVTFKPKSLAAEVARPVSLPDARRFRIITALLVGMLMAIILAGVILLIGGTGMLALLHLYNLTNARWPGWTLDLVLPWNVGVFFLPVLPIGVVITFILIGGVAHLIFRRRDMPPERQERAAAIGEYTSGMLIWLPLPIAVIAAMTYEDLDDHVPEQLLQSPRPAAGWRCGPTTGARRAARG